MFEFMSWCDECRGESVFELVPDRDDEYLCRSCSAAVVITDDSGVLHLAGA